MSKFYQWLGNDLLLNLSVQPNAKHDELVAEYGDNLKVRITALPVKNKANKYLLHYLSKIFDVPSSHIKGENKRYKRVRMSSPQNIPEFINNN